MPEKSVTKDALLAALKPGANNGQDVKTLVFLLDTTPRAIRNLVSELRIDGHPICAHPKTGYYLASTQEELDATCQYLKERALHSLRLYSKLKHAPIVATIRDDFSGPEEQGAFA